MQLHVHVIYCSRMYCFRASNCIETVSFLFLVALWHQLPPSHTRGLVASTPSLTHAHTLQLNEVMEKETYKTARELLEKYDPSNPSLQTTPSRGGPRQASNQNAGQELRRRRAPPSTPHPALMPQNVAMATPQVPRPPIPMATPVAPVSNQQQPLAAPTPAPVPATPQPSLQHIPPGEQVTVAWAIECLI